MFQYGLGPSIGIMEAPDGTTSPAEGAWRKVCYWHDFEIDQQDQMRCKDCSGFLKCYKARRPSGSPAPMPDQMGLPTGQSYLKVSIT